MKYHFMLDCEFTTNAGIFHVYKESLAIRGNYNLAPSLDE